MASGSFFVMCFNIIYLFDTYSNLITCRSENNCPTSFLILIQALHCFCLLTVTTFLRPIEICSLLNKSHRIIRESEQVHYNDKLYIFIKIVLIYVFMFLQFISNFIFVSPFNETMKWFFRTFVQLILYSIDGLIVSVCLILVPYYKYINNDIARLKQCENSNKQIKKITNRIWSLGCNVKQLNSCIGPILIIAVIFKQVEIVGMSYFYILSEYIFFENKIFQFINIFYPAFNFFMICYSCGSLTGEVKYYLNIVLH